MMWILGIVPVLLLIVTVFYYNKLVVSKNKIEAAWDDIDVQLQRHYQLIPQLLKTLKQYAIHEKGVLEKLNRVRTVAMSASKGANQRDRARADSDITSVIQDLFIVSKKYPNLMGNENFLQVQETISRVEHDIHSSRRYYNALVRDYNSLVETFPGVLFAQMFGFVHQDGLENQDSQN